MSICQRRNSCTHLVRHVQKVDNLLLDKLSVKWAHSRFVCFFLSRWCYFVVDEEVSCPSVISRYKTKWSHFSQSLNSIVSVLEPRIYPFFKSFNVIPRFIFLSFFKKLQFPLLPKWFPQLATLQRRMLPSSVN